MWFQKKECMAMPFPLKHIEDEKFVFINGWRFEDLDSHKSVSPTIAMEQPLAPIAPSEVMLYKIQKFGKLCTLEEFLNACPKEINAKSTHIEVSEDGEICLAIRGQWPNIHYEEEAKEFRKQLRKWEKDYKFWSSIK
jgi:hypothetical protein